MQNDMRNRLANLLYEAEGKVNNEYPTVEMVAEHLIANDVVPVLRCKECKNYEHMSCNNQYFCNRFGGYVTENDYCSRCERKQR